MGREPHRDHNVQHRTLLVQQVRLCHRCCSLHRRSDRRRDRRGVVVSQRGCTSFRGRGFWANIYAKVTPPQFISFARFPVPSCVRERGRVARLLSRTIRLTPGAPCLPPNSSSVHKARLE